MNINAQTITPFNSCVMGGSYDMPTLGHYHLIEKAATIFDCVYVILAENASKKSKAMFTEEERIAMLKDMANSIDPSGNKVKVMVSPPNAYLVTLASQLGAKFLIRGIRDQIDFGYEQNIYRTNRKIQPEVETIYLMPDDAYSLVSSSWVKGLVGYTGWTEVIKDCVTPFVLNELKKYYLKGKFMELTKTHPLNHTLRLDGEDIWSEIVKGYGGKSYHGFTHLMSFLDALYTYVEKPDPLMVYAIFMHDIDPDEEKSVEIAQDNIRMVSHGMGEEDIKEKIARLVLATKHNTCEYKKEDEQIMASLDLLILASNIDEYAKYVQNVFDEYWKASGKTKEEFMPLWYKGRSEFLQKMLDRKVIFPWAKLSELELPAKIHMRNELAELKQKTECNFI